MMRENSMTRRRDKRVWLVALGVFVVVFLTTFLAQRFSGGEAEALTTAGFDPGYIISDYQMGNYNSMSEGDIQAFLKSKNSCNDTNLGKYTTGEKVGYFSEMSPPRTWHVANGHFVCMADEVFDGGTAAHIIYMAAQDYRINPQVLLVLLEKEQSLVTDTFPHSQQYRSATGYGCPDTAACSSKYYGLQNQIRNAAALFRTVLDGGWTNYPLGENYVQYNPNAACGGSVVNIRSRATSALYRYTPYQPNAAVLNGWNDGCGAYGNINFYSLFRNWFGDPIKYRAEIEINERYKAVDGGKYLGDIIGGINCNIGHDGACVQAYERGVIIYNKTAGAWENYGEIRRRYVELGSVDNARLGFPVGSINCYMKDDEEYCVQAFEKGIVVDSDNHGTWENFGMIRQRYRDLGSVNSSLGFPIGGENCNIGHDGACVQQYEGGVIIAQAKTGAWENYGEIRRRYVELGSVDNIRLGFPVGSINCYMKDDEEYCVQPYERGIIVDSASHGTWENFGMIRQRYRDLGSVNSSLGFPIGGENCNIGHDGACVQQYEGGVIIAQAKTGAWENYGEIRRRYVELGSVDGILGMPVGPTNCNIGHDGACVQAFKNGVIIYNPRTGAWESYGRTREEHVRAGSVDGYLGFPIGGVDLVDGKYMQNFEGGRI